MRCDVTIADPYATRKRRAGSYLWSHAFAPSIGTLPFWVLHLSYVSEATMFCQLGANPVSRAAKHAYLHVILNLQRYNKLYEPMDFRQFLRMHARRFRPPRCAHAQMAACIVCVGQWSVLTRGVIRRRQGVVARFQPLTLTYAFATKLQKT